MTLGVSEWGFRGGAVAVLRTGRLGDTVCAIPAFRRLREHFSDRGLVLVCDEAPGGRVGPREVCEWLGIFDSVETYRSRPGFQGLAALLGAVRRAGAAEIVMLPPVREAPGRSRFRARLLRVLSGARVRCPGVVKSEGQWRPNEAERLLQVLEGLGIRGSKPAYALPEDRGLALGVDAVLASAGCGATDAFAVFCGGGACATQRWPIEGYREVMRELHDRFGLRFVGIGTPEETAAWEREFGGDADWFCRIPGGLAVPEMAEVLRRARCYLGNDTGVMHLAAAAECPVVAILSARNEPGMWDPDVEPRLVIRHRTECEGCWLRECEVEAHRCMREISVERVVRESVAFLKGLLEERRNGRAGRAI